jgi:hypothetical protein
MLTPEQKVKRMATPQPFCVRVLKIAERKERERSFASRFPGQLPFLAAKAKDHE